MASTRYSISAPPLPLSNAARVLAASDTLFILSRSSSPSLTPWKDHPRWTAQKVIWLEVEEWGVITTMATTPPNMVARGARAKNVSTALVVGGAPTTIWIVTARTARPASCRGTMGNMSATVTQIPCTATISETCLSRPLRVIMMSSAQPVRAWPWHLKANSWRGAPGQHWLSARLRKPIGSHRSI